MAEEIKLVISSKKRSMVILRYIGLLPKIFLVVSSFLFLFWFFSCSIRVLYGTLQQVLCNGNLFCMFKVYEVVVSVEWLPLVPVGAVTINIDKFHWEANVALTFEEWQLDYTEWLILTKSFLSHLVTQMLLDYSAWQEKTYKQTSNSLNMVINISLSCFNWKGKNPFSGFSGHFN